MRDEELYFVAGLIDRIATGDQPAFRKLFEHYRNRVYGVAYKLTQSASVAEEIVEDVFMAIWLRRSRLSDVQNFEAYILTITRNNAYKALNKIARDFCLSTFPEDEFATNRNSVEDYVAEKQYLELLDSAINKLPKQQKLVFRLIKEQGMNRDEVAAMLQLSPETVKFHLSQAVKTIRTFCVQHLKMFHWLFLGISYLQVF